MNTRTIRLSAGGLLLLLTMIAGPAPVHADEPFVVKRAEFNLEQSLMRLDLVVHSEIPEYISIAIEQGFAVPIMFEVEILARKAYWFDDRVVALKQQYRLHYQPMLDSYVVIDVNSSERRYFEDRDMAVRIIEVVYNYPMLDINNLAPGRDYYARVRYGIDSDELPRPLKSSSLWDNDWDLKSDWYKWDIQGPGS